MKLFVKFLLFLLVLAFAGQFVVKGPDGKPLMSLDKLFPGKGGSITSIANQAQSAISGGATSTSSEPASGNSDTVYKWKDKNGVWQYTQNPPPGTTNEKMTFNYKQNIIEAPKKAETETHDTSSETAGTGKKKRQLIMASSAKNGGGGKSGGDNSKEGQSANPALDVLESGELGKPGLTTVPLDKLPALINQAKSLNSTMENRTKQLDSQINGY